MSFIPGYVQCDLDCATLAPMDVDRFSREQVYSLLRKRGWAIVKSNGGYEAYSPHALVEVCPECVALLVEFARWPK